MAKINYLPKDTRQVGDELHSLMTELFPLCRSLTGKGVTHTLELLQKRIPISIQEVPTGTKAFDWTVPKEWNIRDAFVRDSSGRKVIDFKKSNLHVLGYSSPVNQSMSLDELRPHLHTLPNYPDWIPYVTSYYNEDWGFCLTHRQYEQMADDQYEVVIDSTLSEGVLQYGEFLIPGRRKEEFLISTYLCHPSMCNDNLSGVVLTAELARWLQSKDLEYSYRFLFIPETIGAIVWLSRNEGILPRIKSGLVATCLGDPGDFTYKRSRQGDALIDRACEIVLRDSQRSHQILDYFPLGSDERQYCSPGFNLPIGSLMRSRYHIFPEYHTSADNLSFVTPCALGETFGLYLSVLYLFENNRVYKSTNPYCEPQLGKRGLYEALGGPKTMDQKKSAIMWVLNLADGENSLLDMAYRSELPFGILAEVAQLLEHHELLEAIKH